MRCMLEHMVVPRLVYPLAGGLAFVLWVFYTLSLLLVGNLMSVDEDWEGWGDIFLNPYIMVPWLLLGTAFVTFGLMHRRCNLR